MATYKVLLTVKDRYGSQKELDAGHIEVDTRLTDSDLSRLDLPVYVPNMEYDILKYTLTYGETDKELSFDIDKSNEWDETINSTKSNYVWEPMTTIKSTEEL